MSVSTRFKLFTLSLFTVAGLAAYANVVNNFFLSDDFAQIGKVLAGDLSVTWGRQHGGFFRPFFILSYFIDAGLWGRHQLGFHLTNLGAHVLNSFLVFLVCLSLTTESVLTPTQQKKEAFAAGLIFLFHPSHTEAVSWISGRSDLLVTLFCLSALLVFLSYLRTEKRLPLVASLLLFGIALLSKESAVCFPLVIFLTTFYLGRRVDFASVSKRSFMLMLPYAGVLTVYVAVRAAALGAVVAGYGAEQHLNFSHGVIVSQLLRFLLRLTLPAVALRSFPFLESRALSPTLIVIGSIVAVFTAVALIRPQMRRAFVAGFKQNTFFWFLGALALCCLLPTINLRINIFDSQGERFLYLPSAFFSIAVAYLLMKVAGKREKLWAALISAWLLFYVFGLWKTNQSWKEAAQLSQNIMDGIVRLSTHDKVLLLNAPDNVRGAYVYRNGFEEAIGSFQNVKTFARADVIFFQEMERRTDEVFITKDAGAIALRPANPRTSFAGVRAAHPCIAATDSGHGLLRFHLRECGEVFDVFVVTSGEVLKVAQTR